MKLKTFADESITGSNMDAFEHDALAAHALMMALSQWLGVSTNDECAGNAVTWIYHRADEIMRSQGFDSGEVE